MAFGFYLIPVGVSAWLADQFITDLTSAATDVLAAMGIAIVTEHAILGREIHSYEAGRQAISRALPAAWSYVLAGVIILALLLLLIIPGVIWIIYYSFVPYVVALRGRSGKSALDYSKSVVKGNWWKVLAVVLLLAFFNTGLTWLLSRFQPVIAEFPITLAVFALLVPVAAFKEVFMTVFFLSLERSKNFL